MMGLVSPRGPASDCDEVKLGGLNPEAPERALEVGGTKLISGSPSNSGSKLMKSEEVGGTLPLRVDVGNGLAPVMR